MAAPTILGVGGSPFAGYTFGDLVEHGLNERGLTADASSTEYTQASSGVQTKQKLFIKEGLNYLYSVRELYWPQRYQSVTAEAQANGKYSRVACPADMGRLEAITIGGRPLRPLTQEEYVANLRPDDEGGGSLLTDLSGTALCYWLGVNAAASGGLVVQVLPEQSAAFDLVFHYRASGQGLSANADVVLLPLALQPLLVLYSNYKWRLDDGDPRGATALWAHFQDRVDELSFLPPATGLHPVVHSTLPVETATRRQ